jgi:hypothetical protein
MADNYKCGDTVTAKTELQHFARAYSQPTLFRDAQQRWIHEPCNLPVIPTPRTLDRS